MSVSQNKAEENKDDDGVDCQCTCGCQAPHGNDHDWCDRCEEGGCR